MPCNGIAVLRGVLRITDDLTPDERALVRRALAKAIAAQWPVRADGADAWEVEVGRSVVRVEVDGELRYRISGQLASAVEPYIQAIVPGIRQAILVDRAERTIRARYYVESAQTVGGYRVLTVEV
jgi:hypothetical protein